MLAYIAEFLGTMILIILGCGVVANVNLNKSGMKGAGPIQITLGWGLAVMIPAYIFGAASGAHFNPALTIALALDGTISWSGVFCTAPSIEDKPLNFLSEIIGTFILVFAIKGISNVAGAGDIGLGNIFVFGIIVSVGMSLGGLTGYAINPARDIGPRLAHALLPIEGKCDSGWGYAIVPLLGPIVGAIIAVLVYGAIPW